MFALLSRPHSYDNGPTSFSLFLLFLLYLYLSIRIYIAFRLSPYITIPLPVKRATRIEEKKIIIRIQHPMLVSLSRYFYLLRKFLPLWDTQEAIESGPPGLGFSLRVSPKNLHPAIRPLFYS